VRSAEREQAEALLNQLLILQLSTWSKEDFELYDWALRAENELREILSRA
jgi:hypothetical protein